MFLEGVRGRSRGLFWVFSWEEKLGKKGREGETKGQLRSFERMS